MVRCQMFWGGVSDGFLSAFVGFVIRDDVLLCILKITTKNSEKYTKMGAETDKKKTRMGGFGSRDTVGRDSDFQDINIGALLLTQ